MSLVQSNYAVHPFGHYSFNVCQETNYFDCLDLLRVYNKNNRDKKQMKDINKFMKKSSFMRAIIADFDKLVNSNKLDISYLEHLDITYLEYLGVDIDDQKSLDLRNDIKYKYMIRRIEPHKGNITSIHELKIHPMITIRVSAWMSSVFGAVVLLAVKSLASTELIFIGGYDTPIDLSYPKNLRNNTEETISDRLAEEYSGDRDVLTSNNHRIDVLTPDHIIKVNAFNARVRAIGQVLYYQTDYLAHNMWIHLFDHNEYRDIIFEQTCKNNNIHLTYE
jgi:hypothetical protein